MYYVDCDTVLNKDSVLQWKGVNNASYYMVTSKRAGEILETSIIYGTSIPVKKTKDMVEYTVKGVCRDNRLFGSLLGKSIIARPSLIVSTYICEHYEELHSKISKNKTISEECVNELLDDLWFSWYHKETNGEGYQDNTGSEEIDPSKVVNKYIELYSKNGKYQKNKPKIEKLQNGIEILRAAEEDDEFNMDTEEYLFSKPSLDREELDNPLYTVLEHDNLYDALLLFLTSTNNKDIPGVRLLDNIDRLMDEMSPNTSTCGVADDNSIGLLGRVMFVDYRESSSTLISAFMEIVRAKQKNPERFNEVYTEVKEDLTNNNIVLTRAVKF